MSCQSLFDDATVAAVIVRCVPRTSDRTRILFVAEFPSTVNVPVTVMLDPSVKNAPVDAPPVLVSVANECAPFKLHPVGDVRFTTFHVKAPPSRFPLIFTVDVPAFKVAPVDVATKPLKLSVLDPSVRTRVPVPINSNAFDVTVFPFVSSVPR